MCRRSQTLLNQRPEERAQPRQRKADRNSDPGSLVRPRGQSGEDATSFIQPGKFAALLAPQFEAVPLGRLCRKRRRNINGKSGRKRAATRRAWMQR